MLWLGEAESADRGDHARAADQADVRTPFNGSDPAMGTWRAMLAVEAGDPERTLQGAAKADPARIVSRGHRAASAIEPARVGHAGR
ncbi:hypothetical protein [Thermomonospora sp. CIF 1]|nr:hypothetical protein [Thermomonospora sp. CIF 1]